MGLRSGATRSPGAKLPVDYSDRLVAVRHGRCRLTSTAALSSKLGSLVPGAPAGTPGMIQ